MSSYLFSHLKVLLRDSPGLGTILKVAVNKRTKSACLHGDIILEGQCVSQPGLVPQTAQTWVA